MSNFLTAIDNCAQLNSKVKTPAKEKNFPSLSFDNHNSYSIHFGILACIYIYVVISQIGKVFLLIARAEKKFKNVPLNTE